MIQWMSIGLFVFASFSLWIIFGAQHHRNQMANGQTIDGYMIEARYTQFDPQGQIHSRLYSPKMTHFPQDNISYFDHPEVIAYTKQRIPWIVHALQGKSIHDGQQIDLWGEVNIHQTPEPNYPETSILTNAITVYPHRSYAQTEQAITIIRPNTHLEAIGMEAYFKAGIFKLLSAVRGTYVPPPPKENN